MWAEQFLHLECVGSAVRLPIGEYTTRELGWLPAGGRGRTPRRTGKAGPFPPARPRHPIAVSCFYHDATRWRGGNVVEAFYDEEERRRGPRARRPIIPAALPCLALRFHRRYGRGRGQPTRQPPPARDVKVFRKRRPRTANPGRERGEDGGKNRQGPRSLKSLVSHNPCDCEA